MAKLTLNDVNSGQGTTNALNANNDLVEAALENTLSRDGTSPNAMSASLDMNSNKIINVATPTADSDAATKAYVDGTGGGTDYLPLDDTDTYWDAGSKLISNVTDPSGLQDAATKNYVDTSISGGGNVSAPVNPTDDNKVLKASGGSFSWESFVVSMISDAQTFMKTFLTDASAGAARTTLGAAGLADANVFTKSQTWKKGADVASAAALAVDVDGNFFDVTGTTTITSLSTKGIGTIVVLHFDGILTLTHHTTTLILPSAANITTAVGDIATFYEYAAGDWRCISYTRKDGTSIAASASGAFTTGDTKTTYKTTADSGWIMMDDGSIGNASSSATTRANADTSSLYALLWDNTTASECAIQNSSGTPVTKGIDAATDYAANRRLVLPRIKGHAIGVAGTSGTTPTTTARTLADSIGEETHTLTSSEMPAHTHTTAFCTSGTGGGLTEISGSTDSDNTNQNETSSSTGSSAAHTNMQPTSFMNVMIKL